jgi:cytoskeleton protein RodZ
MSEAGAEQSTPRTPGTILREARQAQGLHIAALSASIKVAQRKLEALEADRYDELPDATFTRALAQTVCRALKIDPAPVLALMPAPAGHRLEHVGEGINEPFRDKPGRREPNDWSMLTSVGVWGPLLLVIAAVVLYLMPAGWFNALQPTTAGPAPQAASAPRAASAVSADEPSPSGTVSVMMAPPLIPEAASAPTAEAPSAPALMPPVTPMPTGATAAAPAIAAVPSSVPASGALQVRAKAATWVEVQDARSKVLIARTVNAGETVSLDAPPPLRLKIGNAGGTEVIYRGEPLDLTPSTRDNVARLQLK